IGGQMSADSVEHKGGTMSSVSSNEAVRYERDGDLAVLTISNPPLNLYTAAVSSGVGEGITRAEADGARTLLLRAEGRFFSAGVDVHGFEGEDGPGRISGLLSQRLQDL